MTADELQAQEMAKAAGTIAELTGTLTEQLKAVKPLTREQIDAMAKQAHETSPELRRLDAETRRLEAIDSHLPGGRRERIGKGSQGGTEKQEVPKAQRAQDAQEVRQSF